MIIERKNVFEGGFDKIKKRISKLEDTSIEITQ